MPCLLCDLYFSFCLSFPSPPPSLNFFPSLHFRFSLEFFFLSVFEEKTRKKKWKEKYTKKNPRQRESGKIGNIYITICFLLSRAKKRKKKQELSARRVFIRGEQKKEKKQKTKKTLNHLI